MIFTYGHANGNEHVAAWLYEVAFSGQRQLNQPNFAAVYFHFTKTGPMAPKNMDRGRPRFARTPDHEEHILQAVGDDARSSTFM